MAATIAWSGTHVKLLRGSWLKIQSLQQRVKWSAFGKYVGSLWLCKWAFGHVISHVNTVQVYGI